MLITNVTGGLVIRGESAGTTLIQYGLTGTPTNTAVDIFQVSNASDPAQFGVRFRDLTLKYASGLYVPASVTSAINCLGGTAYITAEDCGFHNCPQAFVTGSFDHAGLHSGLIDCTVSQDSGGYSNSTQVVLGAPEAFVINTDIFQPKGGGLTGVTGIAVQGTMTTPAEACKIQSCHITYYDTGIAVQDHSQFTYITDCEVDCLSGLSIVPLDSDGTIYGTYVTASKFGVETPDNSIAGIIIDTNGGAATNVEGTFIVDCLVYGYNNAGLQINNAQSVGVIGGKYSSNGQAPAITPPAGIALTGECVDVRIIGVDCSPAFDWLGAYPPEQTYAISVVSGVTGVIVSGCNLAGYATPLDVPTNATDLRVTDCAGYNDQGTVVTSAAPTNGVAFNGGSLGYYGPVTFYANSTTEAAISQIAIQGHNTNLLSGTFTLAPGITPAAQIYWGGMGSPNFLMIGQ